MAEFTPGPWQKYERYVTDEQGRTIAYAGGTDHGHNEDDANAHLIAASPDLFAACQEVMEACPDCQRGECDRYSHLVVRAALEKVDEV